MQKKFYSLFLVPCSLVLCLALVFLMSCGDDKEDPQPPPPPPSSSSFQNPPCINDCNNGKVLIRDLGLSISSDWKLKIEGEVEYNWTPYVL